MSSNEKSFKGDEPIITTTLPEFKAPPPSNKKEKLEWDRMSTRMEGFHSYFRDTFRQIYELSDKLESNQISLKAYLNQCTTLNEHLTMHHAIEEQHIFPILAQRMPEFRDAHAKEHEEIHSGMERFMDYVNKVKANPSSYSSEEFRIVLASWGPILMHHLDAEVKTLRGENLRRYFTLEEVRALPM